MGDIMYIIDTAEEGYSGFGRDIAATVGFFDGVHRGHRFLIGQLKNAAREAGLPSAVITFANHPKEVLSDSYQPSLLTTTSEKTGLLQGLGIDYCILLPFTPELAGKTAEEFIKEYLCDRFHVKILLVGHDHGFGKGRTDSFADYERYTAECGMRVIRAEEYGNDKLYNSTTIRRLLEEGKVRQAAGLLSYNYSWQGWVTNGNRLGRTIGFPTANLEPVWEEKVIPAPGVYAVRATVDGRTYNAMLYIGTRPTISDAGERRIEVYLLDFYGDIYGSRILIEFIEFVRGDLKFDNLEELRLQLIKDKDKVIHLLAP